MRQRYTIDLQRYPRQEATIELAAEGLAEAQAKALDMARSPDFPWISEHEGARVTKVIVHAGKAPDDPG
jgi:Zn-dependent alcohol dehydrogenase